MNVKLARIKLGLTQKQLAKILKITVNRLVEIEKGNYKNLRHPLMVKLSEVLNTSVKELFFTDEI